MSPTCPTTLKRANEVQHVVATAKLASLKEWLLNLGITLVRVFYMCAGQAAQPTLYYLL